MTRHQAVVDRLRRALDPNPYDVPDYRRRWAAAREVCDGPLATMYTTERLAGPRRSHSLFEGYDYDTPSIRRGDGR